MSLPPTPYLRFAFPHAEPCDLEWLGTLQDDTFNPGCGYTTTAESALLYRLACAFPGEWIEIGSHTGWSGAHIASAPGVMLHAVEPMFKVAAFYRRALENWARAGVLHRIVPHSACSWELTLDGETFQGAFVDGDHEPGQPLRDAEILLPLMAERCVIAFHDHVGPPVQEAVTWLTGHGFNSVVYLTVQQLAVCWRGDWTPCDL